MVGHIAGDKPRMKCSLVPLTQIISPVSDCQRADGSLLPTRVLFFPPVTNTPLVYFRFKDKVAEVLLTLSDREPQLSRVMLALKTGLLRFLKHLQNIFGTSDSF